MKYLILKHFTWVFTVFKSIPVKGVSSLKRLIRPQMTKIQMAEADYDHNSYMITMFYSFIEQKQT